MGYYNMIYQYNENKFLEKCKKSKVDGLIVVDLPYPENKNFASKCKEKGINFIQLVSPTTSQIRLKKIIKDSHDMIYYISMLSTTGGKLKVSPNKILEKYNKIKKQNKSKNVVRFPAWIDFEVYKNVVPTREDNQIYKILFIGGVTDRKKPHMVIEALPKLNNKNVEFHIVGPTPNQQYLERINNLIDEHNLEDKVFIHGIKNRDEVVEFYKTSNLMILPSVSEGLARVIFESQVTSCPVLVTDAPGMQDIVIDGQTGFVFESNNLESLVLKMNEVFDDYNQSIQIGRNAKDFILENFSEDKFKFSFKKIFDLV